MTSIIENNENDHDKELLLFFINFSGQLYVNSTVLRDASRAGLTYLFLSTLQKRLVADLGD